MKKLIYVGLALLAISSQAYGDTIFLRSGIQMKGTITESNETEVILDSAEGPLKISRAQILKIESDNIQTSITPIIQRESFVGEIPPQTLELRAGRQLSNTEAEAGIYFEGAVMIPRSPTFAFGFGIGNSRFDNKVETLSKGTVNMRPVMAKIRLMAPLEKGIEVFVEGGPAYYSMSHEINGQAIAEAQSLHLNIQENIKNVLGGFIGIGLESTVSDNLGFHLFATHHFVKPEVEATATNFITGATAKATQKVDLSPTIVGVVISVAFR